VLECRASLQWFCAKIDGRTRRAGGVPQVHEERALPRVHLMPAQRGREALLAVDMATPYIDNQPLLHPETREWDRTAVA